MNSLSKSGLMTASSLGQRESMPKKTFQRWTPSSSLEARTALRLGKLATQARLRIVRDSLEWSFVLNATELSTSGVKLPPVLAKEIDEKLYERMYLLEQLDLMVKGLFGQFIKLRLSDEWDAQCLPEIQSWVGQQSSSSGRPMTRRPTVAAVEDKSESAQEVETEAFVERTVDPAISSELSVESDSSIDTDDGSSDRNEDLPPWEDPIGE